MAQKYTILKAITRTSNKGFTLLELLVGMIITLIIGGLAMQAFINASATFSKDKKSIDSTQNLSAVLEIIGNDIRQSGENISDPSFPTIEFTTNTESGSMTGSSKIIVRRALSDPLTLCQNITATTDPNTITELIIADNSLAATAPNCDVGGTSSQLLVSRPSATNSQSKSYPQPIPATVDASNSFPSISGESQLFPSALRKARDYRCQQDNPNPTTAYDSLSNAIVDFCDGSTSEKVRIAVSDSKGHFLLFNLKGESGVSGNTTDTATTTPFVKKYKIAVDTTGIPTAINNRNKAVAYPIASPANPIYLIEERIYTLDSDGNLKVSIDGGTASTLIKRIAKFTVSARIYGDPVAKTIKNNPDAPCITTPAASANTQFLEDSTYTCKFNGSNTTTATATDPTYNWKTLAGVKIEVQAKYDGTGGVSETSTAPADVAAVDAAKVKLSAAAEFFPRNVLSK